MKRITLSLLLLLSAAIVAAGTIKLTDRTALNQSAYKLMEYQHTHMSDPDVYFSLGNIYSALVDGEHPIRDYNELKTELYNIALFYGNCLHYAQGTNTFKSELYQSVPHQGKYPTYEDLTGYLTPRIEQARQAQKDVESLYHAYIALRDNIDRCRVLFSRFSEQFPREKEAHLLMEATGALNDLTHLRLCADSLNGHISAYLSALTQYPIPDYSPSFSWQEIRLYRVDGLTDINLLDNEIALWDYSSWVKSFIYQQQTLYQDYYQTLDEVHSHSDYEYILNLINRMDYESFMYSYISTLLYARQSQRAAQDSLWYQTPSEDFLPNALEVMYDQYRLLENAQVEYQLLTKRMDANQLSKYQHLLNKWQIPTVDAVRRSATDYVEQCHSNYAAMSERIAGTIETGTFSSYYNEFTEETITLSQLEEWGVTDYGTVVRVLPVADHYLAFYANGSTIAFYSQPEVEERLGRLNTYSEHSTTKDAYVLHGNTIAVVGVDHVQFIDYQGKIK